jgi:hypothetical protein
MRGYPIIFGEGVDPDAYQYFLRAGIASGTQTPSSYDNAASFNGTNQFLSRASNSTLQLGGTDFTISFWSNTSSTTGYVIGGDRVSMGNGYAVMRTANGFLFLYSDGATWRFLTNMTTAPNTWNFVTYTLTGSTMRRYLNGSLVGTETLTVPIQTLNGSTFYLATDNSSQQFSGSLANTAIWKRALSASEVSQLWNSGAGRTYGSLDSGLLTNLVSWWALNGTSSAVSLTDSHGVVTGTPNNLTNNGTVTAPNIGPIVTTTENSRQLINNFVKGIKSLGLWNSMVCWPLRSSQNVGAGLTARSLGGLGNFDGTLAGSAPPTWGSDGINCATASQRLTFGPAVNIQSYGGFTIFGTQIHRNLSSSSELSLLTRNDSLWPESTHQAVSQSSTLIRIGTSPSRHVTATRNGTEQNRFHSYHATVDSNESGFLTYNKTSPVAFGSPATTGVPPTTGWTLNWGCTGVYAMHGVMRSYTQGQQAQLYDLYRRTLGLGLGLP